MLSTDTSIVLEIRALSAQGKLSANTAYAALAEVDLTLPFGQVLGLASADSAGELLLRVIAGEIPFTHGSITLHSPSEQSVLWLDEQTMPEAIDPQVSLILSNEPQGEMCWLPEMVHNHSLAAIVASKNSSRLLRLCDRVIFLKSGRVVSEITPEDTLFSAQSPIYTISIIGHLDPARASWFEGLEIIPCGNMTILRGYLSDQAALFGVLNRIRDLGMALHEVHSSEN
jgi:ABC-type sulfate/molybdate transport systems ATPase subunit